MRIFKLLILSLSMITSINLNAQEIEKEMFKPFGENTNVCYGNALIPTIYDTIVEKVIIREGYAYLKYTPEVYDTITEMILVTPGYTTYEVEEPVFETEKIRISIKDIEAIVNTSNVTTPSKVTERIETAPTIKVWKKTKRKRNCKSKDPENCLTWQVVTIPATYIDIEKDIPSTIKKNNNDITQIDGQTITIEKKILVKEASVKEINILPEYKEVTRYVKIKEARFEQVNVAPEYRDVNTLRVISEGGNIQPVEVLCQKEYPMYIRSLQEKLTSLGYEIGPIDGLLGRKTKNALTEYQAKNNLPIGQLDFASLKHLGIYTD
jgi:hypothetical protein